MPFQYIPGSGHEYEMHFVLHLEGSNSKFDFSMEALLLDLTRGAGCEILGPVAAIPLCFFTLENHAFQWPWHMPITSTCSALLVIIIKTLIKS